MKSLLLALLACALQEDLHRILERLRSDDFQIRQRATDELCRLGPKVLPQVRELVATTTDAEVRSRLLEAMIELERLDRVSRYRPQFKDFTVSSDRRSLVDTLASLREVSPVPMKIPINLPGDVSIGLDRVSFWDALERLRRAHGAFCYDVDLLSGQMNIVVKEKPIRHWPGGAAGPFLLKANRVSTSRVLAPSSAQEWTAVEFSIYCLPLVRPMETSLRVTSIVDDLGTEYVGKLDQGNAFPLGKHLKLQIGASVCEGAVRLKVKGLVVAVYPRDVRSLQIQEPTKALSKEFSGGDLCLRTLEMRTTAQGLQVSFTMGMPTIAPDAYRKRRENLSYVFWTRDGRPLPCDDFDIMERKDGDRVKLWLQGVRLDDIAALEVAELVGREELSYPFVVEDVPLQ